MKIDDQEIIDFLGDHSEWVSASTLASQFNVSMRTIRNHVSNIKKTNNIVESGPLGYKIIRKSKNTLNIKKSPILNSNDIGESIFINIFTYSTSGIRLTDLMEQTYFSESTLRNSISKFNQKYSKYNISISVLGGEVTLKGSEFDRRRIFHRLIGTRLKNTSNENLQFNIQELIPHIPIDSIRKIINTRVNQHDLIVNGYELNDLLLHYAIAISRITHGKKYEKISKQNIQIKERPEYKITQKIVSDISKVYQIKFNDFETEGLTLALIGKTISTNVDTQKFEDLKKFVPEKIIETSLDVIADVDKEYNLSLENSEFLIRFIIHINNMLKRTNFKTSHPGSEFEYLTKMYPFIYDLSLYVLNDLSNRLGTKFDNEESVYLLLHLGSFLEDTQKAKINTVVLAPEYYNLTEDIIQKVLRDYGNELTITDVITNSSQISDKLKSKLVLTTINIDSNVSKYIVKISPFFTSVDSNNLKHEISVIQHDFQVKLIQEYLTNATYKDLYFQNKNFQTKKECIKFGASILKADGFVSDTFESKILKRESMASTAFGNVAIPHALEMDAKKTGILIINSKDGINWGTNAKCHLILMIAVAKIDIKTFGDLLQALISVLSINKNIELLQKENDFDNFMAKLSKLIQNCNDLG